MKGGNPERILGDDLVGADLERWFGPEVLTFHWVLDRTFRPFFARDFW